MANANANLKPVYGIDAPGVLRGLFLWGAASLLIYASLHSHGHTTFDLHTGSANIHFDIGPMVLWTCSLLLYVIDLKFSKFRHRRTN
jgi:hypothetical protein